jgi:DNA (cytosine-5)-methyltransferase 1
MNDTHVDIYAGIGGFALAAFRAGFQTVAFHEERSYERAVLARHWSWVPIFHDIGDLSAGFPQRGGVGLLTATVPYYPIGRNNRQYSPGDGHGWGDVFPFIQHIRPSWVAAEAVDAFGSVGLDDALADLESLGYAARAYHIPACAVNAPHQRGRLYLLAHTSPDGWERIENEIGFVHYALCGRYWTQDSEVSAGRFSAIVPDWGASEPGMGDADDGLPARLAFGQIRSYNRPWDGEWEGGTQRTVPENHDTRQRRRALEALGRAVVPQVVYPLLAAIRETLP